MAEQADRDGLALGMGSLDHRDRLVDARCLPVEIASAKAHLDAARLASDRETARARPHRRERLRAAHAAYARGEPPAARKAAALMLAAHFYESFAGATNDALADDIDPAACGSSTLTHSDTYSNNPTSGGEG